MSDKNIIVSVVGFLLIVGAALYVISAPKEVIAPSSPVATPSTPTAQFAQCLKEQGVTFYGAFWCPHCKAQQALFGDAAGLLPYVECSTPDGNAQTQFCMDKKIEGYPTWEFADGSRLTGGRTFAELSEKSGCIVPSTE